MHKKAYLINMTYDVTDVEKMNAEKALMNFDFLLKNLDKCENHLDLIYLPFKKKQGTEPDKIFAARAALRRFRDQTIENFNEFKKIAFKCFTLLQPFSFDTQILKLNKSFVISISDIEKQVNRFADLFVNLQSDQFVDALIKGVELIKKETAQLKEIIEERIKNHLQNNILARNWVDNVSKELQYKVEKQEPFSVQLYNDRQNKTQNKENKK